MCSCYAVPVQRCIILVWQTYWSNDVGKMSIIVESRFLYSFLQLQKGHIVYRLWYKTMARFSLVFWMNQYSFDFNPAWSQSEHLGCWILMWNVKTSVVMIKRFDIRSDIQGGALPAQFGSCLILPMSVTTRSLVAPNRTAKFSSRIGGFLNILAAVTTYSSDTKVPEWT